MADADNVVPFTFRMRQEGARQASNTPGGARAGRNPPLVAIADALASPDNTGGSRGHRMDRPVRRTRGTMVFVVRKGHGK